MNLGIRNSNSVFVSTGVPEKTGEAKKIAKIAVKISTRERQARKPGKVTVVKYTTNWIVYKFSVTNYYNSF